MESRLFRPWFVHQSQRAEWWRWLPLRRSCSLPLLMPVPPLNLLQRRQCELKHVIWIYPYTAEGSQFQQNISIYPSIFATCDSNTGWDHVETTSWDEWSWNGTSSMNTVQCNQIDQEPISLQVGSDISMSKFNFSVGKYVKVHFMHPKNFVSWFPHPVFLT